MIIVFLKFILFIQLNYYFKTDLCVWNDNWDYNSKNENINLV